MCCGTCDGRAFSRWNNTTLSVDDMYTWFIRRHNIYMLVLSQVQSHKAYVNDAQCPAMMHYGHGKIHSRWKIRLFFIVILQTSTTAFPHRIRLSTAICSHLRVRRHRCRRVWQPRKHGRFIWMLAHMYTKFQIVPVSRTISPHSTVEWRRNDVRTTSHKVGISADMSGNPKTWL